MNGLRSSDEIEVVEIDEMHTYIGSKKTTVGSTYEGFVPPEKHVQSKKETCTVEGYNSLFRPFLARVRRKTKCYTKAKYMLVYSVKLLMLKWNEQLDMLN